MSLEFPTLYDRAGNKNSKKHGHTWVRENGTVGRSPTYQSWRAMIARCRHETHPWFHAYGDRGIAVCDEWQGRGGFERFLRDMGERPKWGTLDRVDVNKGYFKENCRWATKSEQRRNVRELPVRAKKKGKRKPYARKPKDEQHRAPANLPKVCKTDPLSPPF